MTEFFGGPREGKGNTPPVEMTGILGWARDGKAVVRVYR